MKAYHLYLRIPFYNVLPVVSLGCILLSILKINSYFNYYKLILDIEGKYFKFSSKNLESYQVKNTIANKSNYLYLIIN